MCVGEHLIMQNIPKNAQHKHSASAQTLHPLQQRIQSHQYSIWHQAKQQLLSNQLKKVPTRKILHKDVSLPSINNKENHSQCSQNKQNGMESSQVTPSATPRQSPGKYLSFFRKKAAQTVTIQRNAFSQQLNHQKHLSEQGRVSEQVRQLSVKRQFVVRQKKSSRGRKCVSADPKKMSREALPQKIKNFRKTMFSIKNKDSSVCLEQTPLQKARKLARQCILVPPQSKTQCAMSFEAAIQQMLKRD